MKGLCLNSEVQKAPHLHDKVVSRGFQLNHVSYGILINVLCKMGQARASLLFVLSYIIH